jgi:hypothetical protein
LSNHLTGDDLVLHFYGEMDRPAEEAACRHLAECADCRRDFARLERTLALVSDMPAPDLPPAFTTAVWNRLESALDQEPPRSTRRRVAFFPQRWGWSFPHARGWSQPLAWGAAAAVLLIAAFVAGRTWRDTPAGTSADTSVAQPAATVLLADLDNHLDRAELAIVEFLAAETLDSGEPSRTEDLIAANRLYRGAALGSTDASLAAVLDELERTLIEIATIPAAAGDEELASVRERIDSRDLLTKVRMLRQMLDERTGAGVLDRGTSL